MKQMIEYFYTLDYEVESDVLSDNCISHKDTVAESSEQPVTSENAIPTSETEIEGSLTNVTESLGPQNPDALSFHISMYALADRLLIEGLKALSKENVEHDLVQQLGAGCFPKAITEIYHSTPTHDRGLRDLAIKTTMNHLTTLRTSDETAAAALNNNLLESLPQYSYDLLIAMMDRSVAVWNRSMMI